jgi:predicted transcriptional regulator
LTSLNYIISIIVLLDIGNKLNLVELILIESIPFAGTTMKKYKKQMDWRRNKVRELFSRGYSQFEISNMLHISQSTISRDINYIQNKTNKKDIDPDDQLYEEYEKMDLIFDESIKELWKIIDSSKTSSKEKTKSIGLILTITKERRSILEKKADMLKSKIHENFFGKNPF